MNFINQIGDNNDFANIHILKVYLIVKQPKIIRIKFTQATILRVLVDF